MKGNKMLPVLALGVAGWAAGMPAAAGEASCDSDHDRPAALGCYGVYERGKGDHSCTGQPGGRGNAVHACLYFVSQQYAGTGGAAHGAFSLASRHAGLWGGGTALPL